MRSSTSSSEGSPPGQAAWRRFFALFLLSSGILAGLLYLFVVLVDPWGMLPLRLPLPRVPISTNARFSMPALAVSPRFDSAIVGTSTSRLLRPEALDGPLDARFVNLAMNSATPWEQMRLLELFLRHHKAPKAVIVDVDSAWCLATPETPETTGRAFPRWMYWGSPWRGYLHVANLYAIQEAANQLGVMIGTKRRRYGLDGYTDFLPPDTRYDRRRVDAIFRSWGPPSTEPAEARPHDAAALTPLAAILERLPGTTRKILLMPPIDAPHLGAPGSWLAAKFDSCRTRAIGMVHDMRGAVLVDFAYPNTVTTNRDSFWDPVHYRVPVAGRVMAEIVRGSKTGQAAADGVGRVPAWTPPG